VDQYILQLRGCVHKVTDNETNIFAMTIAIFIPAAARSEANDAGERPDPEGQREGNEEEEERVGSDCVEEIFAMMAQYPQIPIGMDLNRFLLALRGQQRQQEG
jgi:hypothetical protein